MRCWDNARLSIGVYKCIEGEGRLLGASASGGGARTCSWHIIPDITIVLPDIRVVLMVNSHTWSHNISHVLLLTWSWYLHPNISKCESGWELLQVSRPWMLENHLTITSSPKYSGKNTFFRSLSCYCYFIVSFPLEIVTKLFPTLFLSLLFASSQLFASPKFIVRLRLRLRSETDKIGKESQQIRNETLDKPACLTVRVLWFLFLIDICQIRS